MDKRIIISVALIVIIVAVGVSAYFVITNVSKTPPVQIIEPISEINSFEDCINAGYPAMESYPRQCRTDDGKHFVEEVELPVAPPFEDGDVLDKVDNGAGLANPASVYCEDWDGTVEIRDFVDGQKGFCLFEDGSECEEWDYYNDECWEGEVFCKDLCGDGQCQEVVCEAVGCPCSETHETCPEDCK